MRVDRSAFLEDVAMQLRGCEPLGDGLVARTVRESQRKFYRPPHLGTYGKYR
jgi:hypothetical protein